jgi:hypothetical protein
MNVFVFQPGASPPPAANAFNNWMKLVDAVSKVAGRKVFEFDDSIQSPCEIPAGTFPMKDVSV